MTSRLLTLLCALATLLALTPQAAAEPLDPVVRAFQRHAAPLDSAGALTRMLGTATIVGLGEAAHGSGDYLTVKHRIFRQLVRDAGFDAFVIEGSWSSGLRLNDYVQRGVGDPRTILREEFPQPYLWNSEEHLALIEWMRSHNASHARKVHVVGNDVTYSGPELFDRVVAALRRTHPVDADAVATLYAPLRPVDAASFLSTYPARPIESRRADAEAARRAYELVRGLGVDAWVVQHARVILQTFTVWSEGWESRELAMAENVLWWRERTGHRIVLSAHDGHVAVESFWTMFPSVVGTVLRERLGRRYMSVGFTFGQGSFLAFDPSGALRTVTVGAPEPGTNEHALDQVRYDAYALRLRDLPAVATAWLRTPRPTRLYSESYPVPDTQVALGRSFDAVIHLRSVEAAHLLS
jgi:erythromycin esterase